jgi:hypothetical protein
MNEKLEEIRNAISTISYSASEDETWKIQRALELITGLLEELVSRSSPDPKTLPGSTESQ